MVQYDKMAEEIQYYDDELCELCEEIAKGVERLPNLSGDAKQEKIVYLSNRISRARQVFHSFKVEMRELSKSELQIYEQKAKMHNQNISKLISDLNWAKTAGDKKDLLEGRDAAPTEKLTGKALIEYGKKVQDESLDSLARSKALVAESENIGTETAVKLKEQTEQLKQIHEDVQKIESNLKQADKLIRRFMRRMMTDKIVLCLLFFIVVGIVAIIAWHLWGPGSDDDDNNNPNDAPATTAAPLLYWG
eukprot:Rmarinus@m.8277